MKRSRYTSLVTDFPQPGQHLAFNWLTQSMAVLDEDLRGVIESDAPFDAPQVPPDYAQQLETTGLAVADEVDERQEIEDWYGDARCDTSTFKVMMLTTYDCNFACTYCVEEGVKRPVEVAGDLADRIVAWIERRLERHESEKLYLNFYGGEPLLNIDGLERVAAPLSAYARERGLGFGGSVTTNGALLNRRTAERLIRAGVTRAKVTLDGDREAHDARRPFKGGRGSFATIVRNLHEVGDLLSLYLGGNVDCRNQHAIPRLLDFLEAEGLMQKLDGIGFGATSKAAREGFRHLGEAQLPIAPAVIGNQRDAAWICDGVLSDVLAIQRELIRRGLPARKSTDLRLCMLNQQDNGIIIDPTGKLYKCPALVGHEVFRVGDLDRDEIHCEHLRPYPRELDECMDCRWFPVCGGGCRFVSFLETGDIRRRCCIGGFLDAHGDDIIEMKYDVSVPEVA